MADPPGRKVDVARAILESSSLHIHLDPRRPGVQVPRRFTGQPQLVLQVGYAMAVPIPDLKVDDHGVSGTLSFDRAPFRCLIPWSAIYALVSEQGRGGVWQQDVPPEVQEKTAASPPTSDALGPIVRPRDPAPAPAAAEPSCSFCEKSRQDVKLLIAGPRAHICDACVALCSEIIAEQART
jgi:stringent starvation protein B